MKDLFGQNKNGALFSDCRKFRYVLWRIWNDEKPLIMFIGLNPSTANEGQDDPTIKKVKKFANEWGFGGVYMTNLFAFVSPYPDDLKSCNDPLGDNNNWLETVSNNCTEIVFAWGNFDVAFNRAKEVEVMFPYAKCLVKNNNGTPRHPLYVPADTQLKTYNQLLN